MKILPHGVTQPPGTALGLRRERVHFPNPFTFLRNSIPLCSYSSSLPTWGQEPGSTDQLLGRGEFPDHPHLARTTCLRSLRHRGVTDPPCWWGPELPLAHTHWGWGSPPPGPGGGPFLGMGPLTEGGDQTMGPGQGSPHPKGCLKTPLVHGALIPGPPPNPHTCQLHSPPRTSSQALLALETLCILTPHVPPPPPCFWETLVGPGPSPLCGGGHL